MNLLQMNFGKKKHRLQGVWKMRGKQGERNLQTGRKVRGSSLSPPAPMNWGGRPYILERPPSYAGAVGRNRILFCSTILLGESKSSGGSREPSTGADGRPCSGILCRPCVPSLTTWLSCYRRFMPTAIPLPNAKRDTSS